MPISGVVARGGGIGAAAEFKSELVFSGAFFIFVVEMLAELG